MLGGAASDQRVVSISGKEEAGSQLSPAIDALVYCAAPVIQEEGDPQKCVRLVVPSSQVPPPLPVPLLLCALACPACMHQQIADKSFGIEQAYIYNQLLTYTVDA